MCNLIGWEKWDPSQLKLVSSFVNESWYDFYLTNRFYVALRLFNNRSQMKSQNGVRTKTWHTSREASVSLMFLPHFDVFWDLLQNRHTATWSLVVLYNKAVKKLTVTSFMCLSSDRS